MSHIERTVDHVIILTGIDEQVAVSEALEHAGVPMRDDTVEASLGLRSRLHPIRGGGFLEIACELSPGSFAHGNPFDLTPRVASVAYTTDDGATDLQRWRGKPGAERAFAQAGSWRRLDGTMGYFVAVHPAPPAGRVFFGLQERRLFPLPYLDEAGTAPAVRRVEVSGIDAEHWRYEHVELFGLPDAGDGVRAGETEVFFRTTDADPEIVLTLAVPHPEVLVPMRSGAIRFVPADPDQPDRTNRSTTVGTRT
ncbi:MAG: hypothetical protein L0I76_01015 [Pseudonocardia sp.]|nr:hypothetical protein [Pseudonocardia sp.]